MFVQDSQSFGTNAPPGEYLSLFGIPLDPGSNPEWVRARNLFVGC